MIPDEAVEAAGTYMDTAFDYIGSPVDMRLAMKKALEAAAPYMLAAAWDEGALAIMGASGLERTSVLNPYMLANGGLSTLEEVAAEFGVDLKALSDECQRTNTEPADKNDGMTITEFLEARIAEEEAVAREDEAEMTPGSMSIQFYCGTQATFTPSRVLAECAMKRAIIGLAEKVEDAEDQMAIEWGAPEVLAPAILRTLAALYADHDDYDPGWAL